MVDKGLVKPFFFWSVAGVLRGKRICSLIVFDGKSIREKAESSASGEIYVHCWVVEQNYILPTNRSGSALPRLRIA